MKAQVLHTTGPVEEPAPRDDRSAGAGPGTGRDPRPRVGLRRVPHRTRRDRGPARSLACPSCQGIRWWAVSSGPAAGARGSRSAIGSGSPGSLGVRSVRRVPRRRGEPLRRTPDGPARTSTAGTRIHRRSRRPSRYPIPVGFSDLDAAPLLCAGVIGYRALRLSGSPRGRTLALFGFGASAHIVIQVVRAPHPDVEDPRLHAQRASSRPRAAPRRRLGWPAGRRGAFRIRLRHRLHAGGRDRPRRARGPSPGGAWSSTPSASGTPFPRWTTRRTSGTKRKSRASRTSRGATRRSSCPWRLPSPIVPEVRVFGLDEANDALILQKQGAIQAAAVLEVA